PAPRAIRLTAPRVLAHPSRDGHGGAVASSRVEAEPLPLPGARAVRRVDLGERERPLRSPRDVPDVLDRPRPDAVPDRWAARGVAEVEVRVPGHRAVSVRPAPAAARAVPSELHIDGPSDGHAV